VPSFTVSQLLAYAIVAYAIALLLLLPVPSTAQAQTTLSMTYLVPGTLLLNHWATAALADFCFSP